MLDLTTSRISPAFIHKTNAYREAAVIELERIGTRPLRDSCRSAIGPKSYGVYALYRFGQLVYVGKASPRLKKESRRTPTAKYCPSYMIERFRHHRTKLSGRETISVDEVFCKWLSFSAEEISYIDATEAVLIATLNPPWNDAGFGGRGTGRLMQNARSETYVCLWDSWFPKNSVKSKGSLADLLD